MKPESIQAALRPRHQYAVFGLEIASELPLPELYSSQVSLIDVEIVLGSISSESDAPTDGLATETEGAILHIAGVAKYLISNGRRIVVQPDAAGSARHIRLYLLGSAIGVLLHQRQLLPLHANAVELSGRAVAFMGASGAGKSTIAAWFHDRGHRVLADDVCVVTTSELELMAYPGIPRLRLWRDALEASGRSAHAFEHAFDDADKYNVPTRDRPVAGAVPLAAVYLLDNRESQARERSVTRLRGAAAMNALVSNVYRGGYAPKLGALPSLIAKCSELASRVPVFAVSRVWGLNELDDGMAALEQHAEDIVAAPVA